MWKPIYRNCYIYSASLFGQLLWFFLTKMRGSVPGLKLFVVSDWENDTGRKELRRKAQREKEGKKKKER